MKPITPFDNYPSFANGGSRSAPGDAKYALGFVPADTFPAEWANYFFHGATKGVSDLNSAVYSLWNEMGSVLSNYNITPDATDNDQLLECLTKLKTEAALAAHPVGSLYWTSVNENPAVTFGGGTWTQIKDKFILTAGDTYTNGATGGSATVTLTTNQIPSHTHTFIGSAVTSGTNSRGHTHSVGAHSHPINTGNTSSSGKTTTAGFRGISVNTSERSLQPSFKLRQAQYESLEAGNLCTITQTGSDIGIYQLTGPNAKKQVATFNLNHAHSVTASGYLYGKTDNSTAFNSGDESQNHTHSVTASGSNSNTGGGQEHNNMPPYIVKYCWQRTA